MTTTYVPHASGRLLSSIFILSIISLILAVIRPVAALGVLTAFIALILCAIQGASILRARKRGEDIHPAVTFGKISLTAGRFAIILAVIFCIAAVNTPPSSATPAPKKPAAVVAEKKKDDSAEKKAEAEAEAAAAAAAAKEAAEAQKKAEEEKARIDLENAKNEQGTALNVLATLAIKGRAPKTGYARTQFGSPWMDMDRNGCDTRNDILKRDLTGISTDAKSHGCKVLSGTLADPYTGTTIAFTRGRSSSSAVQIDHVVALSDAWQKGAQQLDATRRQAFANDPYNLLAVDGPANMQKSDGDAATWLPPRKDYRCAYVARQIGVKAKYTLWVTQAEHDAMERVLSSCPSERVPEDNGLNLSTVQGQGEAAQSQPQTQPAPAPEPQPQSAPAPAPQPAPAPAPQSPSQPQGGDVSYPNCAAVRAAGKAPLHAGEPGYSYKLDRDRDGVACER
ncbi:hypothetical protein B9G54_05125 [Alloscardovia macacae]|uniref:Excalibur calcium-binding domain-containing protein n=1 Tax=Alloscardovia macacae TaxID=1160091 RepID=A0A1Y2SY09_9BIFI|nr:hypothetical protein B9G54_05125 [Alloscardovia macacae]OTA28829.1 hypothetical protein B9T39_05755 [Alloscardovia macacae]